MIPFSVKLSLYKNDNPEHFKMAMDSIINQSVQPNEIILTIDGPIPDTLNGVVCNYESKIEQLKTIRLPQNKGHGVARQIGVEHCSNQLIAIMDSDDIAVYDRFKMQLQYFEKNPEIDIVGGYISEFIGDVQNITSIRDVPLNHVDVKKYMKKRCPLNQMTVMFKRKSVLKSGNYQDWHYNEDYYLWCRMLLNGCKFGNIPDVLVNVRVGKDMYKRRGGWKYFKSEAKLQKYMLNEGIINIFECFLNVFIRFFVQVLMPSVIRGFVFTKLFRRKMNLK